MNNVVLKVFIATDDKKMVVNICIIGVDKKTFTNLVETFPRQKVKNESFQTRESRKVLTESSKVCN
jgi:hypothetical protein